MVSIELGVSAVAFALALSTGLGVQAELLGNGVAQAQSSQPRVVVEGNTKVAFPTTFVTSTTRATTGLPRAPVERFSKPEGKADRKGRLSSGLFQPYRNDRPRGFYLAKSEGYQGVKNIPGRMINRNSISFSPYLNSTMVGFMSNTTSSSEITTDETNVNISAVANAEVVVIGEGNSTVPADLEAVLRELLVEVQELEQLAEEQFGAHLHPEEDEELEAEIFGEVVEILPPTTNETVIFGEANPSLPPTTTSSATPVIPEGITLGEVVKNCNEDPSPGNLAACACVVTGAFHDNDIALVDAECFETMNREYAAAMVEDEDYYRSYLENLDNQRLKKRNQLTVRGDVFCPITTSDTYESQPEVIYDCFTERDVAYLQYLQTKIDRELLAGAPANHKNLLSRGLLSNKTTRHIQKRGFEGLEGLDGLEALVSSPDEAQIEDIVFAMTDNQLIQLLERLEKVGRQEDMIGLVKLAKRDMDGFEGLEGLERLAKAGDEEIEKLVLEMSRKELGELLSRLEREDRKRRK
ncbi:hypothetical protein BGX38DRAFT_1265330 [Terfezia claveryi]|nr:hypothetical protein BGX38DRAFT_1265330 [Terfezia claveryi]